MRGLLLVSTLFLGFAAAALAQGTPGPMDAPPGLAGPPAQPGAPQPGATGNVQLSISLTGTWRGPDKAAGGEFPPINDIVIYHPDGSFNQWSTFQNGFTVQIWGTFKVSPITPTSGFLEVHPTGWNPTQVCPTAPHGMPGTACAPISIPDSNEQLTVSGNDDIQVSTITLHRDQ
jgi:hypothetical protein